jgi:hypothetical protein
VRADRERVDVRVDPLDVDVGVVDAAAERLALVVRCELAVREQVRDLEEVQPLGDLLDRIAAVAEDPCVAVESRGWS